MTNLHIYAPRGHWTEWKPMKYGDFNHKTIADCCNCRMLCRHTEIRVFVEDDPWNEPIRQVRCATGYGCDANPRRKIGMHLRGWEYVA